MSHHDVVHAHHGNAWHWKLWNQAVASRMAPSSSLTPWMTIMNEINNTSNTSNILPTITTITVQVAVVRYMGGVGANVAAQDSRELMNRYGHCHYHAFEPIPTFYEQLQQRWTGEPRMTIHGYGLWPRKKVPLCDFREFNPWRKYLHCRFSCIGCK